VLDDRTNGQLKAGLGSGTSISHGLKLQTWTSYRPAVITQGPFTDAICPGPPKQAPAKVAGIRGQTHNGKGVCRFGSSTCRHLTSPFPRGAIIAQVSHLCTLESDRPTGGTFAQQVKQPHRNCRQFPVSRAEALFDYVYRPLPNSLLLIIRDLLVVIKDYDRQRNTVVFWPNTRALSLHSTL